MDTIVLFINNFLIRVPEKSRHYVICLSVVIEKCVTRRLELYGNCHLTVVRGV